MSKKSKKDKGDKKKDRAVFLPGSGRSPRPAFKAEKAADPNDPVRLVIKVRPKRPLPDPAALGATPPVDRPVELSRPGHASRFGATQEDIDSVVHFLEEHKMKIVEASPEMRLVVAKGKVKDASAAFDVELMRFRSDTGAEYRGRVGEMRVPYALRDVITAVAGLDDRRQAKQRGLPKSRAIGSSFFPTELAAIYDFPSNNDGSGQCIGIIEFGGGFSTTDLDSYFQGELNMPTPSITAVSVDGTQNDPGTNPGEDGEVMLDIEVAGAVAPGAKIAVYFAQFTEAGWMEAITKAVNDSVNKPSVVSISWGWAELEDAGTVAWTPAIMDEINRTLMEAASMGVTVIVAAGDDGSNDGFNDGKAHVDFPASSPFVLGCGGTTLQASNQTIASETVWNDGPRSSGGTTGGGVSEHFALPDWQAGAHVPPSASTGFVGRGVPDVAGVADPATGYRVRSGGADGVSGGTSAVAPLWAGLLARINQALGSLPGANSVGYFNPLLYSSIGGGSAFHDITQGNNDAVGNLGAYAAGPGWDACTGWGSPDGANLMSALTAPRRTAAVSLAKSPKPGANGAVIADGIDNRLKAIELEMQALRESNGRLAKAIEKLVKKSAPAAPAPAPAAAPGPRRKP